MTERVYVFDLDDTLYLEREYVRSGFAHIEGVAREQYGVRGAGDQAWTLFTQGVRGNTFDLIAQHFGLPPEAVGKLVVAYRDHEPEITLEQDALEYIRHLPGDSIGTAVITDGYAAGQRKKLRALQLDAAFDHVVVTGEHGPNWTKPSLNAFRLIESKFERRGVEFVYFADNPLKDFLAPQRLGWRTVRVRRPHGLHYMVEDTVAVDETISVFPSTVVGRDALDAGSRHDSGRLQQ